MSTRNLLDLPLEILLLVFSLLDGREIAKCRAVCVDFKTAVENSIALQYRIELAICGYADGPYTEDTPAISATRLDQFRRHIDAWNNLEWVETRAIIPYATVKAFSGGTYMSLGHGVATCVQLPSYIRGLPLRTWTLRGISLDLLGIALDPRCDLFVIIQLEQDEHDGITHSVLRLRTLSNNTPHPIAINPAIRILNSRNSWRDLWSPIRIMQHLVGSVFNSSHGVWLFIWDWTAGRQVVSLELGRTYLYRTFAFINTTSFIVLQPSELEMYQLSTDGSESPPIRTASFRLPHALSKEGFVRSRGMDTLYDLPSYGDNGQESLLDRSSIPRDTFPFSIADDNRYIRLYQYTGPPRLAYLYIPLRAFQRCSMHENPFALPYEAWAHGVIFRDNERAYGVVRMRNVHNGRFLFPSGPSPSVVLFDLNRNRARHRSVARNPHVREEPPPAGAGMGVSSDALGDDRGCLDDPVTSRAMDIDTWDIAEYDLLCGDENIIFEKRIEYSNLELIIMTIGAPHN